MFVNVHTGLVVRNCLNFMGKCIFNVAKTMDVGLTFGCIPGVSVLNYTRLFSPRVNLMLFLKHPSETRLLKS